MFIYFEEIIINDKQSYADIVSVLIITLQITSICNGKKLNEYKEI